MTEKSTPGPWHLINEFCVGGPIEPGWEAAGSGVAHCGMRARTPEEAAANARLITAAPDLYKALRSILPTPNDLCLTDENMRLAHEALSKAEGSDGS